MAGNAIRIPSKRAIERLIAGAKAAGLDAAGIRFNPDGSIETVPSAPAPPADDFERWQQGRATA